MKPDQLEKFILDHRDEFDDLEPNEDLFKELNTPKKKVIQLENWKLLGRVAAAIIIFSLGFTLNEFISKDTFKSEAYSNSEYLESDSVRVAIEEMQFYYTSQMSTLTNDIILLSNADQEISNELDFQMEELQTIFEELKEDLNDQANEEEVIEAMILNYRMKLRLLEDMKAQLSTSNQEGEEDYYETIDI